MNDDALYNINTEPEGESVGVDDFFNFVEDEE